MNIVIYISMMILLLIFCCCDIIFQSGGPSWEVPMGRRDSLSASKEAANNNIPSPNSTISSLLSKFENVGLDIKDLVALSGTNLSLLSPYMCARAHDLILLKTRINVMIKIIFFIYSSFFPLLKFVF